MSERQDNVFTSLVDNASQGLSGITHVATVFLTGMMMSVPLVLKTPYTLNKEVVTVKRDLEKEFIDIDFENMQKNKFYLAKYDNTTYAFRKISEHQLESYEVVNG